MNVALWGELLTRCDCCGSCSEDKVEKPLAIERSVVNDALGISININCLHIVVLEEKVSVSDEVVGLRVGGRRGGGVDNLAERKGEPHRPVDDRAEH